MKVPFVNFSKQFRQHWFQYSWAILKCLLSGRLILQRELEEFEENLAKRLGMQYAIGVASGTDALTLAMLAKEEVPVETSGYTFKATMEAVYQASGGVHPRIHDIDENRLVLNVTLPVHIEGMVAKSDKAIVEDAAQAIGAKGVGYSGTFALSFYPAKILGGFGDGGAIVTNNETVYTRARLLRHHWQTGTVERLAYNSRLDNVQAAFLNVKLKYLDKILDRREEIAQKYKELEGCVKLPYYQEGRVWQDYCLEVPNPLELATYLETHGIETLGYDMVPPHKALNTGLNLPNTELLYKQMIRLPLNETLTNKQVDYVIKKVKEYYVS